MTIRGKLKPLHDKILITDMNFSSAVSAGGIILRSTDGKVDGIKPRWGRVWAIGPEQQDIKVGQWILVEHGRWSRAHEYQDENDNKFDIQLVDNNAIMMVSDDIPTGTE